MVKNPSYKVEYKPNSLLASKMESQNCCTTVKQINSLQDVDQQVAVIMVPFPAQGHLNQFLHLSHLISSYKIPVHYVGCTTHNRQAKLRLQGRDAENSSSTIHFHDLEIPPMISSPAAPEKPPNDADAPHFPTQLAHTLIDLTLNLRQPVKKLLQELAEKFRRIVVVYDSLTASVVQDVKTIPNAEAYTFSTFSAFSRFLGIWQEITEKPFELDFDVSTGWFESSEGTWTPKVVQFADYQSRVSGFESGVLFNTCRVIEGKYVEVLEKLSNNNGDCRMKHFALGPFHPLITSESARKSTHGCLAWLDKHEMGSVIYVSFGSTTTMSNEQIRELALGLERSEQKFIWVLRNADAADIFAAEDQELTSPRLPEGYKERVEDRGLVIRDWAPQLEILGHPSVGGFMSHCGWNSCLESISMGVPIVAWPMHTEQPMNAVLVVELLKIGIMVRDWANRGEVITSDTIENVVRRLMASKEGEEIKKRAADIGQKVQCSVAEDGASHLEMKTFIAHITR